MADMSPIKPIQGLKIPEIPGLENVGKKKLGIGNDSKTPSFTEVLSSFFQDVNKLQNDAVQTTQKFALGEIKDVHQVMVAMNEADVAFKLMMEVRNKLVQAYKQVIKTPV